MMRVTVAHVRVMVMMAVVMGAAGAGEWLVNPSPYAYAKMRSTPPSRIPPSPATYRGTYHTLPERGMKALSVRIKSGETFPSNEEVLAQSSEEENTKQLSSSEEEEETEPPPSSSEEAFILPPPPDQDEHMESRPSIVTPSPPLQDIPTPSPTTKAPRRKIVSITRHYQGDIYSLEGGRGCGCREGGAVGPEEGCQCQCPAAAPTFRDDTSICVSVLHECILADFVSTSGSEKIPYVYLPLKHQLVHPTAEVALRGLEHGGLPIMSPVCVVTGASVLTQQGWRNMANTSTFEPPFRLFRDVGRTFVQWVGEAEARRAAEGRLVLVTLICRDAAQPATPVFRPCLSFRVAGSPGSSGAALSAAVPAQEDGTWTALSWGDGVIIGLVVACLTVIYIVGMSVFIQFKRKKKRENSIERKGEEGGNKGGRKGGRDRGRPPRATPKPSLLMAADDNDEIEDLSLASRNRRANRERNRVTYTSAMVHRNGSMAATMAGHDPADGLERVPRSPLAVVTLGDADVGGHLNRNLPGAGMVTQAENHEAQARRKLYFNPAYFEPELLQTPPPAALEFLARIREMISVAKTKMKTKIYHPSLGDIPEEDSDCQSRPVSRTVSGTTVQTEDMQDIYEDAANVSDGTSIQSDSLERRQKESDSRNSTLKRLAQRVNSHGESFVSEIIKTLDLKPRLPASDGSFVSHPATKASASQKSAAPPPPKPVNARNLSPETEDDFPELIKPSMLRNVLRDGKRLTDLNNTFENFRQEMVATFQKMKRVGEAISPKSTLNRNKRKAKASPKGTLERLESDKGASTSGSGEGKVQKWLQTLDGKNSYTRMTEQPTSMSDSQVPMSEDPDQPPPLPEKNSKPPNPPRRHRTPAFRSLSLNEERKGHNEPTSHGNSSEGKSPVTRSLSWQNEHSHYGSNPRRPRPEIPEVPDETHNVSFCSEDDSLNDLVSEAESKVPKMIPSDSESLYSDTKSRANDSLHRRREEDEGHHRQLPREEAMTARNEIYNKWTGAKTMSRLARSVNESYAKVVDRVDENDHEDHTYEEIHITTGKKQRVKRRAPETPNTSHITDEGSAMSKKHHSEGRRSRPQQNGRENIKMDGRDEINHDSQYLHNKSNSMVSEVTIDKCDSPIYSGCKVTIPVADNMESETFDLTAGFDQDTLERRGKKIERSGSIALDSLERPLTKKKTSDNNNVESQESLRSKRRMTLPGDMPRKGDKSLLDIYESRSKVRSPKTTNKDLLERTYPPIKVTDVSRPTKSGSFYLSNINNASITNMSVINNINNNTNNSTTTAPKKYRTFRDYQDMKFVRQSSETEGSSSGSTSSSPLPVTGTSICVNFCDSNSLSKEQGEFKPPLPPKQTRNYEGLSKTVSHPLPPKGETVPPPLPLKSSKKHEPIEADMTPPRLPEKSYRKNYQETSSSRSSSSGSIPELTEEEARTILHGLLAHPSHEGHRLSTLHEEDVGGPFLGEGNTADDCNSQGSVPFLDAFSSGSLESPMSTPTSASTSSHYSMTQPQDLSQEGHLSPEDTTEHPQSPGSEARVSGEFILSTIRRSPTLKRHSSLNKEQMTGFVTRHKGTTEGEFHEEGESEGGDFSLAFKAKSDLEKHFKDKSGGESIKRTWRKILEKVDEPQEGQEHLAEVQVQRVLVNMGPKIKQDDSGYHSTDSSESAHSRNPSQNSSVSSTSVPISTISSSSRLAAKKMSSQSLNRTGLPKRSASLNRMASYSTLDSHHVSSSLQRNSFRASLSRSFPGVLGHSSASSLYINNRFIQDDDDDSLPDRIF